MSIYLKEKIIPAERITNRAPVNLVEEDKFLFENDFVKELPEVNLYYFKNVNVSPHGILFKAFYIYKQFLIWQKHTKEFNVLYLLRNYLKRKVKIAGPQKYLICFDYWSVGYFHWMCDFLPRLLVSESHLQNYTLLLPENHNRPFIETSLQIFNIKNLLRFSDKEYVKCKLAVVTGPLTLSGDNNPQIMQKLRNKFIDHFAPKEIPTYAKNIFVSRAKAKGRYIDNEEEVIETLKPYGFQTIYFEDHSFSEQVNIAFNCKNMVGLHGANLTNILFMKPGANLFELRTRDDNARNYYFSLASTCGLNYFYLQCEPLNRYKNEAPDFRVDTVNLKKQIELMLTY